MEKNHKKDIEQLLIKQTEKIFSELDPATTVVFSKNLRNHCKDLAKKFLKTQKKLKKQLEEITANAPVKFTANQKKEVEVLESKAKLPVKKSVPIKKITPKKAIAKTKAVAPAKQKRVRRGNNLSNASVVQKNAKASLVKNINKSAKK
jgi:hypothetical protein